MADSPFATTHYGDKERIKQQLMDVEKEFPSLYCNTEQYTFKNGHSKNLLNISGTVPVIYKFQKYNIPIKIWLLDTYPNHAPLCYVNPTLGMSIKVSTLVDHNGTIYSPYLSNWDPIKSDLHTLIQFIISSFSEQMPVFQNSPPATTAYPTNPQYSGYLPYPTGMSMPAPHHHVPQRIPGLPFPNPPVPHRHLPQGIPGEPFPNPPYHAGMQNSAPGIPYPGQGFQGFPGVQNNMPPYPVAQTLPYSPHPGYPPTTTTTTTTQALTSSGTITEEHLRTSLLSAVEDKLRVNMKENTAQWLAELETLEKIQSELTRGKERINHLMNSLEQEQSDWEKVLTTLRDKDLELDAALLTINNQGDVNVDEAVTTTAPLYKQLLTAFAEEAATEDAIYYLGEALRRGVIDLDIFLKHVRSLSRKQFMLRALMDKCRNKAGLF